MQEKAGIKDNADLLYSDILKAGGGLAHKELARRIADESVSNYKWLRDEVGVKFKAVTYHGGHSVPRSHAVMENTAPVSSIRCSQNARNSASKFS